MGMESGAGGVVISPVGVFSVSECLFLVEGL